MSDKNYYSYGPFRPERPDRQPSQGEETTSYVSPSGEEGTAAISRPRPAYRLPEPAEQRYREWSYPVKKKSSFRSALLSFLAGALVVSGLMFAADRSNLFGGDGQASSAAGNGGGNGGSSVNTPAPTVVTEGGVRSAALQDVVRPGNIAEIVQMASPAVVKVETYVQSSRRRSTIDPFFRQFFGDSFQEDSGGRVQAGAGSGFIFDKDGYILTNQHVIEGADEVYVHVLGYAEPFKAEVLGSNFDLDLAALKIEGDADFPTLTLGNSDEAQVGDWVVAIGNPYGFDHTVTVGVLSAKERPIRIPDTSGTRNYEHLLQTDASINPGNSGGPLLNLSGEVIGINTAVSTQAQGIGFAIPTSTIASVIDNLKNDIPIPKPYVGIYMQDLTPQGLERLGLDNGVIITGIIENSPAQEAGLRAYDVIVEMDGQKVTTADDLASRIGKKKVGDKVDLRIYRDGEMVSTRVIVGDKNKR